MSRSRSSSSNLSSSFVDASATLRPKRDGAAHGTNPASPLANGSSGGGVIGGASVAAASEDAAEAAAPNPYAVFAVAAPQSPSRQEGPVAAPAAADAAAAPNPYMKFAAAAGVAAGAGSTQGVSKKVPSASCPADTVQAAGPAPAANPYARFQQAAAPPSTASPAPAAAAANPYERFLKPAAAASPATANGVASPPAKAKVTAEGAGTAASLEAVALLATQMPSDVEVRLMPQRVHATRHQPIMQARHPLRDVAVTDSDP